jgi:F-type H+-transporting ATPase subunit c
MSVHQAVLAAASSGSTTGGTLNMVGYGLAAIGPGIGVGIVFAAYINGTARQPELQSRLQTIAFLGFALSEALAIIGIALAFVLKSNNT